MNQEQEIDGRIVFKYETDWKALLESERFKKELCDDILEPYISYALPSVE